MITRCLPASTHNATVAQVQRLVDGLDAEIAPDEVPSFEAWGPPERPA